MADERENIRPPDKSLTPGQKPAPTADVPAAPKKEVPIGFGVITPEMERYRAMIAKDPSSRVFAALAELYRKAGMLDEAVRLCLSGTKAHPKYMSGRVALARAYLDKGMLKEAKEEVLTVVSITPDNILANKILGEIHLSEGDTPKAIESFTKVLTLAPDDAEARQRLLEAGSAPDKPTQPEGEAEEILDGEILEEVSESEFSEVPDTATPVGGEGQLPAQGPVSTPSEEIAAAGGPIPEAEDLDIPLEDDGSLDDLLTGEAGKRVRGDEHAEEEAGEAQAERGGGEGELREVEEEPEDRAPETAVGYAPDEGSEADADGEAVDGDIDLEGDQELVDEFGILEEDEGEITVEGLDNSHQAAGRVSKGVSPEKGRETDTRQPQGVEKRAPVDEDEIPDTQGVTITTETIADIYVKQGYFDKALTVYEELLSVSPTRDSLKQKIAFVRKKMREAGGDHQETPVMPRVTGEEMTVAPNVPEAAGDRKLRENVETLNRWLAAIRKLRRI